MVDDVARINGSRRSPTMAQKVRVLLTDDVDGTEIPSGKGETVVFGLDGKSYEIDLTSKNATALRRAIKPYVDAGRPSGARSVPTPERSRSGPAPTATP
jgi:Lsr2